MRLSQHALSDIVFVIGEHLVLTGPLLQLLLNYGMVLRLSSLIFLLGDLLSREVGPADRTIQRLEAPGIDAARMEGVCTGSLAHQVVSFDLHQADGADVAVVAQSKRLEDGHFRLEVGNVVDFGHLR